jgi:DNA-binding CsgD family transcriptional regulator
VRGARPAVEALARRLGLWDADGQLSHEEVADPLWRALGEAAAASSLAGHAVLCQVPVELDERVQAIDVLAIPETSAASPSLAIVVRVRADVLGLLARRFAFTPAEAEVAVALAEGQDKDEIARYRGLGRSVVRHQVRTALAKAGLRHQPDLAALVARLLSPPDA